MQSVKLKISKLKNNSGQIAGVKKNPRIQDDSKFQKLKKSLQDFPEMLELRELVVYPLNGDYIVVGGNMRLKALKELGEKEAVCKVLPDNFPLEKINEFIIKDNVSFGLWDGAELSEWDAELLNEWGYEVPDWEIAKEAEAVEDNYEIPNEIKTDVVLGDLITFEKNGKELHRLMCGDSTDSDSVAKLMNGEKADMVFTDPPYGMKLDTDYSGMSGGDRKGKKYDKVIGDNEDFKPELIHTIFACFDYCEEIFIWGVDYYFDLIPNFKSGSLIVWDKTLQTNGDAGYNSEFELCWSKTPHKKEVLHFNWFRYFGLSSQDIKTREHPTQKPLQVITPFIEKYSQNIIADLFIGSGSTMVAAHQLNRKCYGMELDEKYCQVIIDRMKKLDSELTVKINGVVYE